MGYPEFVNTMKNCCQVMQRVITFAAVKKFMFAARKSQKALFSSAD
jgi:hypothetical protein